MRKWASFATLLGLVFVVGVLFFSSETRTEERVLEARFEALLPVPEWPEFPYYRFTLVKTPNYHFVLVSKDVGRYLATVKDDTVPLTFRLRYQDEKLKSVVLIGIGSLSAWDEKWFDLVMAGPTEPAPW